MLKNERMGYVGLESILSTLSLAETEREKAREKRKREKRTEKRTENREEKKEERGREERGKKREFSGAGLAATICRN